MPCHVLGTRDFCASSAVGSSGCCASHQSMRRACCSRVTVLARLCQTSPPGTLTRVARVLLTDLPCSTNSSRLWDGSVGLGNHLFTRDVVSSFAIFAMRAALPVAASSLRAARCLHIAAVSFLSCSCWCSQACSAPTAAWQLCRTMAAAISPQRARCFSCIAPASHPPSYMGLSAVHSGAWHP